MRRGSFKVELVPDIRLNDLPDASDEQAIFRFAMTFNGYEHFGSFESCAAAARASKRSTLLEVRNELFIEARASRHRGDDNYVQTYRELLPTILSLLA